MTERRGWELGGKNEGIKKYQLVLTECHRDVGHIIRNSVMTMYGAWWIVEILGEHCKLHGFLTTMLYT